MNKASEEKLLKAWIQAFPNKSCGNLKGKGCFDKDLKAIRETDFGQGKKHVVEKLTEVPQASWALAPGTKDFWLAQLKNDSFHPCTSGKKWDAANNNCIPCPSGKWHHEKKICTTQKLLQKKEKFLKNIMKKGKVQKKRHTTGSVKRRGTLKRISAPAAFDLTKVNAAKQIKLLKAKGIVPPSVFGPCREDEYFSPQKGKCRKKSKKKKWKKGSKKASKASSKRGSKASSKRGSKASSKRGSKASSKRGSKRASKRGSKKASVKRASSKRGSKKRASSKVWQPVVRKIKTRRSTGFLQKRHSLKQKRTSAEGQLEFLKDHKKRQSLAQRQLIEAMKKQCLQNSSMVWQQGQCLPKTPRGSIPTCGVSNSTLSLIASAMAQAGEYSGKRPMYYQQHVIERLLCSQERGFLLYFLTGGGKTLTSLFAAKAYARKISCAERTPNVVIVGPNAVIQQWIEVIETLIHKEKRKLLYNSLLDKKSEAPEKPDSSHMQKYNSLGIGKHKKTTELYVNDWEGGSIIVGKENYLLELDSFETHIDLLIVDEAHRYRTYEESDTPENDSAMARKLQQISKLPLVDKFLLLTATPLVNKNEDILPLLNIINNKDTSLQQLQSFIKNPKNSENYIRNVLYFFKQDKSYPLAIYKVHFVPLTRTNSDAIKKMLAGEDTFWTKSRKLASITSEKEVSKKIEAVVSEILNIWNKTQGKEGKKIVVYARFRDTIDAIHKMVSRFSKHVYQITGSENDVYKKQAQINFNNRGYQEPTLLLISEAGTTGVDLSRTGHVMLTEAVWHLSVRNQVEGRGVRKNSHAGIKDARVIIHHFYGVYPENHAKLEAMKKVNNEEFTKTGLFDMVDFEKNRKATADVQILKILEEKRNKTEKFQNLLKQNNNLFSESGSLESVCD